MIFSMSINIDIERHLTNSNAHSFKKKKNKNTWQITKRRKLPQLNRKALKNPGASSTLKVEIWNACLLRSGIK